MRVSRPWLAATVVLTLFIWGNSLVPATGSSTMSLTVVHAAHACLGAVGLPSEWVTHVLIRKTAHFSEYALLGIFVSQAVAGAGCLTRRTALVVAVALICIPSVDETIQLFVPGRSGQVSDVLLDCCGAATGALARSLAHRARRAPRRA